MPMNCWIALPLTLVMLTSSRCAREKDTLRIEPLRFEDGSSVVSDEPERLAAAWKEGSMDRVCFIGDGTSRTVDYSDLSAYGDEAVSGLVDQDPLLSDFTLTEDGDTLLHIRHASAFLRMELTGIPANTSIARIDLIPTDGEIATTASFCNGSPTPTKKTLCKAFPGTRMPDDGPLVLWAAFAPQDFSDGSFAVVIHGDDGNRWTSRLPGLSFSGGTACRRTVSCFDKVAPDPGLSASPLPQALVGTDAGEYSGITWISEDSYAVVSDNLKGGGIVLFTIPIDADGTVGEVSARTPDGTVQAAGRSRDTEGIAFVPGRNRLYVSSEKDLDIREYDLEGRETGPGLRIPADLSVSAIAANKGLEALSFNDGTGLFWTTTEAPLKRDTFLPRLHRLQSFDRDGNPAGRYFYETEAPSKSSAEAAGAQAYVFGIPAIAALDDGRLIVLEREVYVPKGGLLDKFLDSYTRTSLFVVDPVRDEAGILRKSLICTFTTSAMGLANYEGMCLGPTLPDGRRCLLLIADSQNSAGGYTQEFVKVVLLR